MAIIETEVKIDAEIDKVWSIVSDLDNETKFWKGTKSIRNISKEDNRVKREVTIAFRDSKCMQDVTITPKEKIYAEFTEGMIKGSKTILISPSDNGTILQTVWDIKLSGMFGMFTGMVKKHIKSGTEQALQSIKQEAES